MRLALIANPRSGTAPDPAQLAALLAVDGAAVDYVPIEQIADRHEGALEDGALSALQAAGALDRIAVAGGDGSIACAAEAAGRAGVPLAVIPVGTANDFARAQRLPLDDVEAACALARHPTAHTRHAELGRAGERPFVNVASAGLAVAAADAARPHKSRLGSLAYAVGAIKAAVTAEPLRCAVTCDGEPCFEGRAWQVVVGVTGAFGGGSEIGVTSAQDARLDVAVVPAGSRVGLVRRAYGMRTGRLTGQSDVAHERGAAIDVAVAGHRTFNVDGETCRCEPAHFTLHPGGFDVVTPS